MTTHESPPPGGALSSAEWTTDAHAGAPRLHQPWRVAVAAGEVVLALLLVVGAWQAWGMGVVPFGVPAPNGATGELNRSTGSWLAASIGAATCAGLCVLDAGRQLVLAWRVRRD
ncbi:hypothetical protein [Parasphingorhabdus pacifica]